MKRTGDNTTMVEMPGGKFYEVRGNAMLALIDPRPGLNLCGLTEAGLVKLEALRGKRVLILELVDKEGE